MIRYKINSNGFVEVEIPPSIQLLAKQKSETNYINNHKSLEAYGSKRSVDNNIIGNLGELVFSELTNLPILNHIHYDFKTKDGLKIDIKSKGINLEPRGTFDVSVLEYSAVNQMNDYYVFVRIKKDYSKCWIVGQISKQDFLSKSIKYKAGDVDTSNNHRFMKDARNMLIKNLEVFNLSDYK